MIELLKDLIQSAPTLNNGELRAAEVLADFFRQHGIPAELDTWNGNRANVTASVGPDNSDAATLLFGAHLDVVPATKDHWKADPFCPVEEDGKIIGRGSVDMLGGLCAAAAAMVDLSRQQLNGRIIFAATAGEETDSCGVQRFVEQYRSRIKNPIGTIITEPTGMKILRAHRGILWLKVETKGKTAHGSMPHLGVNAVLKMNAFLNRLEHWEIPHTPHPLLGGCSISPNRITGGSATNIIPDSCCLEIDIRTLPKQNHREIIENLKALCESIQNEDPDFKTQISIIRAVDAMETPADSPFVKAVCKAAGIHETQAAGFTTDGPHFQKLKAPVLILGPGDGTRCHKPDESIEISAVEQARQTYQTIAANVL
ncbi:MAG: M20 family metallopeptidase [Phycisphaerae bacterium]|nr:M20 family metallopeptidase [Phycisphaerae bacterium]